jgi:hypothetical protein
MRRFLSDLSDNDDGSKCKSSDSVFCMMTSNGRYRDLIFSLKKTKLFSVSTDLIGKGLKKVRAIEHRRVPTGHSKVTRKELNSGTPLMRTDIIFRPLSTETSPSVGSAEHNRSRRRVVPCTQGPALPDARSPQCGVVRSSWITAGTSAGSPLHQAAR